jgi:TolB-like protein
LSKDDENAFFADGVQDEILTRLSKIGDLKVISRTSTQKYKSAPENLRRIGQQLGVGTVLEGSVQKARDQVRVTVQLINASNDAHLWAETYDRKLVDIFAVQSDIAQKIAAALEARLTGREKRAIAHVGTTNSEAYNAYLQAVTLRNSQSERDAEKVIQLCTRAVELDPKFAQAWALLAGTEANKYFGRRSDEQFARAKHAAETAMKLDPDLGEAHTAMGSFLYYCMRDFDGALREFEEARERLPNDGYVLLFTGLVKRRQGKLDEALELHHRAAELDPRNQDIWVNLARGYRGGRRFAQAHEMFDRALAVAPGDQQILAQKAETYIAQGDLEAASATTAGVAYPFGNRGHGSQMVPLVFRRQYADAIAKLSADYAAAKGLPPISVAIYHAVMGQLRLQAGEKEDGRRFLLEAQRQFEMLREQGDKGAFLHQWLIRVVARLGDRARVEQEAVKTLAVTEGDAWDHPKTEAMVAEAFAIVGRRDPRDRAPRACACSAGDRVHHSRSSASRSRCGIQFAMIRAFRSSHPLHEPARFFLRAQAAECLSSRGGRMR